MDGLITFHLTYFSNFGSTAKFESWLICRFFFHGVIPARCAEDSDKSWLCIEVRSSADAVGWGLQHSQQQNEDILTVESQVPVQYGLS